MIGNRTTFVIGAGASKSYGLPTATELNFIATKLLEPRTSAYQLIVRHVKPQIEVAQLNALLEDLKHHPALSIDAYLESRQHTPDAVRIGKAVIAALMGQAIEQAPGHLDVHDDWLGYVIERMREGTATWQRFNEGNANVRFITFNFDTVVEERLAKDIKRIHPSVSDHELIAALNRWVVHLHGQLPIIPEKPLMDDPLRARAKTNSQMGRDSVVPFREDLTGLEAKCLKLFGRGLHAGRIVAAIQVRGDRQPGLGSGGADEAEDLLVAVERLTRPVFGDLREEAMLDGVPLGRARGIVGHREGEAKGIGELGLEFGFPGAAAGGGHGHSARRLRGATSVQSRARQRPACRARCRR